jgi:GNAT superfamily N-acetyltransferase
MLINNQQIKKIPEVLIYKHSSSYDYSMLNIKTGKLIGRMSVVPRKDLYIDMLNIRKSERKKGYGYMFLDFAQNVSKSLGLGGRLRVLASLLGNDVKQPPHKFYRKYGFTSDDIKSLSVIDSAIEEKKNLLSDFTPIYMYYPSKK